MKFCKSCLWLLLSYSVSAQETPEAASHSFKFSGNLQITNNGISPIPSFSLGKPAFLAFLSLKKRKFSYSPETAFGSDARPWFMGNWFRYKLIDKKFELGVGINGTLFFTRSTVYENGIPADIVKALRYASFEGAGTYHLSDRSSIGLVCWLAHGFDPGTVNGYFIDLTGNFSKISLTRSVFLSFNPQIFYIDYTANSDGLFISGSLNFSYKKFPLSFFTQGVQSISTNIDPDPGYQWNVGLSFSF